MSSKAKKSLLKTKRVRKCKIVNNYKGWCPQKTSKQWLERINAEMITPIQFYNRYVKRRMPVILVSSNTECLRAFTPEALAAVSGECVVHVEKADEDSYQPFGRTDANSRRTMKFSEFIARMKEDELYCSTQPLPEDKQGPKKITSPHVQRLIDRGLIPEQLPLMGNLTLYQLNAWIGCSEDGTSSGFHHDYHDNLYMLLAGEKQFRIASPNFASEAPTFGCRSRSEVHVHPNGLISYDGDAVREDGARVVDVLKWKLKQKKFAAQKAELQDELEERMLDQMMDDADSMGKEPSEFPPSFCVESTAHGEYITETIKTGEMLYLPASFFHEVVSFNSGSTTHHTAINYWYYPPSSSGTFEDPYEDNYWSDRWGRIEEAEFGRKQLKRQRMRRNKLPLRCQYSKKEIMRFVKHIEKYKKSIAT